VQYASQRIHVKGPGVHGQQSRNLGRGFGQGPKLRFFNPEVPQPHRDANIPFQVMHSLYGLLGRLQYRQPAHVPAQEAGHDLAEAVRTVAASGALIEPSVARKVVAEFARMAPPARTPEAGLPEPLSEREREILELLAQGLSNREIGIRLSLAQGTVKNYVTTILQKMGVRDRTQAALRARELGLL